MRHRRQLDRRQLDTRENHQNPRRSDPRFHQVQVGCTRPPWHSMAVSHCHGTPWHSMAHLCTRWLFGVRASTLPAAWEKKQAHSGCPCCRCDVWQVRTHNPPRAMQKAVVSVLLSVFALQSLLLRDKRNRASVLALHRQLAAPLTIHKHHVFQAFLSASHRS